MKKVMIGIGAFVSGVITGAAAMLVYKNIQIGKKSKLHEENYNNLNDLFGQQDSSNKTNIFNDTFSSSFSKSDLADVFGVNFDSGDENYEDDTEDWSSIEVKNHFDSESSLDIGSNFDSESSLDIGLNSDNDTEDWFSASFGGRLPIIADAYTEDEEYDEEPKSYDEDEEYDESPEDEEEDIDWSPEGEDEEFEEYDEEPKGFEEFEEYDEESKGHDEDEEYDEEHDTEDEEYDDFVIEDEPEDGISDWLEDFESEIKDVFEV